MAYGPTLLLVGLVVVAVASVNWMLSWQGDKPARELRAAQSTIAALQVEPTDVATVFAGSVSPDWDATRQAGPVVAAVVQHDPTQTPVVVTATSTPAPQIVTEYREIYIDVPVEVEVTRIIEVTPVALPTVTPMALAPGSVEICVRMEGVRDVYVGQNGMVPGACKVFAVGIGATYIDVQVNR